MHTELKPQGSSGIPPPPVRLGAGCGWVVCVCAHGRSMCVHTCVYTHVCGHMHASVHMCVHVCVCGGAWLWWEGENDFKHTPKMPPPTVWHI